MFILVKVSGGDGIKQSLSPVGAHHHRSLRSQIPTILLFHTFSLVHCFQERMHSIGCMFHTCTAPIQYGHARSVFFPFFYNPPKYKIYVWIHTLSLIYILHPHDLYFNFSMWDNYTAFHILYFFCNLHSHALIFIFLMWNNYIQLHPHALFINFLIIYGYITLIVS